MTANVCQCDHCRPCDNPDAPCWRQGYGHVHPPATATALARVREHVTNAHADFDFEDCPVCVSIAREYRALMRGER